MTRSISENNAEQQAQINGELHSALNPVGVDNPLYRPFGVPQPTNLDPLPSSLPVEDEKENPPVDTGGLEQKVENEDGVFEMPKSLLTYIDELIISNKKNKQLPVLKWDLDPESKLLHSPSQVESILDRFHQLGSITDEQYEVALKHLHNETVLPEETQNVSTEEASVELTPGRNDDSVEVRDNMIQFPARSLPEADTHGGMSEDSLIDEERILDDARSAYATELIAWKNSQREKKNKFSRLLSDLGVEKQLPEAEEPADLREARAIYIRLKKIKSRELFSQADDWETTNRETGEVTGGYTFNAVLLDEMQKEFDRLQKTIMESLPEIERGRISKGLEKWGKMPKAARILTSTALLTGTGLAFGSIALGGAAAFAGYRAGKGLAGALAGQGVGKMVDGIFKKTNAKRSDDIKFEYGKNIDADNFEEKEAEMMRALEREQNIQKRQRLYKAGAMAAVGAGVTAGLGSIGTSSLHHSSGIGRVLENKNPSLARDASRGLDLHSQVPSGEAPETFSVPKSAVFEKNIDLPKTSLPESLPVSNVAQEVLKPAEIKLSSQGFIQDIHNLKAEILRQYDGEEIPESIRTKILDKPAVDLAKEFHFYDPTTNESAISFKGETLGIDTKGNLVLQHLDGSKDVVVNVGTGEVHQYTGKMFVPHDEMEKIVDGRVSAPQNQVPELSSDTTVPVPPVFGEEIISQNMPIPGEVNVSLSSPDQVLYHDGALDVVSKSGVKSALFNNVEIAHEQNGILVLDDKFQNGAQYKEMRSAFATAFEKNTLADSLGKTPLAIPFENGKIHLVRGIEGNPNALRVLLNGKEIAKGVVGAKISLIDAPGIKSGLFFADTVYERAFKHAGTIIKTLKPI